MALVKKNRISDFLEINSCPVVNRKVISKCVYNNCHLMHKHIVIHFYDGCHVSFFAVFSL